MASAYNIDTYNVFEHNCNHFAKDSIGVRSGPSSQPPVRTLPNPLANHHMSQGHSQPHTLPTLPSPDVHFLTLPTSTVPSILQYLTGGQGEVPTFIMDLSDKALVNLPKGQAALTRTIANQVRSTERRVYSRAVRWCGPQEGGFTLGP